MSSQRQGTIKDLVEEAKKRVVVLAICVVGLSYIMSLTSSSVWVNLPGAACLIVLLRYFSLDIEMRRKAAAYNSKSSSTNVESQKKPPELPKTAQRSDWRDKVNSPVVESAIDQLTRHLISEWVTDLWYSRITPDKEAPEELVHMINGVLGELSGRIRNINLIDFLTRDLIILMCRNLELFRESQAKIEKQQPGSLTFEHRDMKIRSILAAANKLHPALFSTESEHKVLQHLMEGLISLTFRPDDLQCSFFRCTARELLACAVIRPVLNLASPRFINERIESVVKAKEGVASASEASLSRSNEMLRTSPDRFSKNLDPSVTGVELVQLRNDDPKTAGGTAVMKDLNGTDRSKDPLLSIDTRSSRSWSSLPLNAKTNDEIGIPRNCSGEWGDVLDVVSRMKKEALAPEHLENIWAKGRNYKQESAIESSTGKSVTSNNSRGTPTPNGRNTNEFQGRTIQTGYRNQLKGASSIPHIVGNLSNYSAIDSYSEDDEQNSTSLENVEADYNSSCTSEDDETSNVMGLGSPGTKVWDGRANRNLAVSHIHHPLENSRSHRRKKTSGGGHAKYQDLPRSQSGRKRFRRSRQNLPVWQEVQRTSFLSGDGQDILSPLQLNATTDSDNSDTEHIGRQNSGASASSSLSFFSIPETSTHSVNSVQSSLMLDSFAKLRCEVMGANIVKSSSNMFAVYSISVVDESKNSWSIKRRFRHFEELHRRLKEFPEYNFQLPPKHFLSTGVDVLVIQERCILLDRYLKKLLQLPRVSGSIDVWDFLSVDSQTYVFSNSFSIVETLSVSERSKKIPNNIGPLHGTASSSKENLGTQSMESRFLTDGSKFNAKDVHRLPVGGPRKEYKKSPTDGHSLSLTQKSSPSNSEFRKNANGKDIGDRKETSELLLDAAVDALPTEWVPPKLTLPLLDLVDFVFQLQEGGWIRRKAFWVAKQILQLGMGDALDDWLLEKIRLLRKGSVVASGINRVEQILWPDGIFLTKHPKRQRPASSSNSSPSSTQPSPRFNQELQQQQEDDRRAKLVYELMTDKAPVAIVSLIGQKEYAQCANDLYFFLQSSVCLKQLAFELLELMLLSAFPEMDSVFKEIHEEKHKFGEFKAN